MRRYLSLALLFLVALTGLAYAQQATFTAPVTPPAENNLRPEAVYITRDAGGRWEVTLSVRDSGGTELRRLTYSGPDAAHPGATALAFATAYDTARSGETGTIPRRLDFRTLGFLADQGYISGVTLVP
jgi:hypothetical protein